MLIPLTRETRKFQASGRNEARRVVWHNPDDRDSIKNPAKGARERGAYAVAVLRFFDLVCVHIQRDRRPGVAHLPRDPHDVEALSNEERSV